MMSSSDDLEAEKLMEKVSMEYLSYDRRLDVSGTPRRKYRSRYNFASKSCQKPTRQKTVTPRSATPGSCNSYNDHRISLFDDGCSDLKACRRALLLTPKTPKECDRFIPCRSAMDVSDSHDEIVHTLCDENNVPNVRDDVASNAKFVATMGSNLKSVYRMCNDSQGPKRIMHFGPTKTPKKGILANLMERSESQKASYQHCIPTLPERVLDAPDYVDDYYLNLLDWGKTSDRLAVALGPSVYIWQHETGETVQLCDLQSGGSDYVTSLKWANTGLFLAVGASNGCIQLWDVQQKKLLRQMVGHQSRVGSLDWKEYVLTSGSRSSDIHNHDVRVAQHHIGSFSCHTHEVCGLQWSPCGQYLASGSNDNKIYIWHSNNVSCVEGARPVHSLCRHTAAVKALAWCPWQHHMLASGGGAADKTIKFWNINSGTCQKSVDVQSQVSAIIWSADYKEIVTGHGYPKNELSVWQYPSMTKKGDLLGHNGRILQLTMSSDCTRVMSASSDETLRLWHLFERPPEKMCARKTDSARNCLSMTIR